MSNEIPVGALVRVRDSALTSHAYGSQNRDYAKAHGYLHIVISNDADGLKFKSIVTGHEHRFFFDDEVEEAPTDD